jgi:hypothetical protein
MNDTFTRADLEALLNTRNETCLSLIIPTAKAGPEIRQNSIRFKNLLAETETLMSRRGLSSDFSDKILNPLRKLVPDTFFWTNQSTGLALFCLPESLSTYRLPMECRELTVFADHFHLKPLIRFLQNDRTFYLLALSRNKARFLYSSARQVALLDPPNMPRSLAEALKYDDPQRQLQFHTGTHGGAGKRPAMFHGHGVGIDEGKNNALRYAYHVNKSLESILREQKVPLILATVDDLYPIYSTANTYPHLLEDFIEGNPDDLSDEDLQNLALPFMERLSRKEEEKAIAIFEQKAGTGFTSTNLKEVILSAQQGRVDVLFVAADVEQWGAVEKRGNKVNLHAGRKVESYDLLNYAAVQTQLHGGSVFVLSRDRVPEGLIAAIFRY